MANAVVLNNLSPATGLCDDYQRRSGIRLKGEEIVRLAEQGDTLAEQSLQAYERRLAKALAAYINVLAWYSLAVSVTLNAFIAMCLNYCAIIFLVKNAQPKSKKQYMAIPAVCVGGLVMATRKIIAFHYCCTKRKKK